MSIKRRFDGTPLPPGGYGSWLVYLVELVEKHRYERPMPYPTDLSRDEIREALKAELDDLILAAGLGEGRAMLDDLYLPELNPDFTGVRRIFASPVEKLGRPTEYAIKRFVDLLSGRYDVAHVIVFGSRARGTHRKDSDLDLAVLLRGDPERFLDVKEIMADVAFDAMLQSQILISPLPIWMSEWEHPQDYSNPELLRAIAEEGIWLI
jgi:predicted nucleotidyltransferase